MIQQGDRVGLKDDIYTNKKSNPWHSITGVEGTVEDSSSSWVAVNWDNGTENNYSQFELFVIDEMLLDVNELFEDIEL